MRDSHRLKEKYDLSLDNRQIGTLLIGGIVVLGAVFILGVVVGKKLATSDRAAAAPDLLSALDQKAAATEEARDASLTFQDELTKKVDPVPSTTKPETPKHEPNKPDPVKKPDADKNEKALAEAAEDVVKPEPAKLADAKEPAPDPKVPVPDARVESTPVTTRTAGKDGGLKDAFAHVEKRPTEVAANGPYTLQISASQSRGEADKFAGRLRDKGYAPYIVEAQVPGRGTWYRVRMGSFPSKEAAARYLQDFKRETQLEAFVAAK